MARNRANAVEHEIAREMDVLKAHLGQLTELVEEYGSKKGDDVAASLSGKAREFLDHAQDTSRRFGEHLSSLAEGGGDAARRVKDVAAREVERVEATVVERPLISVLCAAGAGVAIGWLIGRR